MGEDQDAAGARSLDEAQRGHGLAGTGGVLEPEAAGRARVLEGRSAAASSSASSAGSQSSGSSSVSSSPSISTSPEGSSSAATGRRAVGARSARLQLRGERDQRAGEGVDLVRVQHRAVGQVRLVLGQHPLEPQHERVVAPPLDRGLVAAGIELRQRVIERGAAGGALRERRPASSPSSTNGSRANSSARCEVLAGNRRGCDHGASVSHVGRLSSGNGQPGTSRGEYGPGAELAGSALLYSPLS